METHLAICNEGKPSEHRPDQLEPRFGQIIAGGNHGPPDVMFIALLLCETNGQKNEVSH